MNIKIIYDNNTIDNELKTGWGLSMLIDDHILFDTGDNGEALLFNLAASGVSLDRIKKIFISHDHWDHWGGLWDLLEKTPGAEVHFPPGFSDEFKHKIARYGVSSCVRDDSYEISPDIFVMKELPFTYKGTPMVERGFVCRGDKTILVSGCAHPGILEMHKKASQTFPSMDITGVIGGFHLEAKSESSNRALYAECKQTFPDMFLPLHCSGPFIRTLAGCTAAAGSDISF